MDHKETHVDTGAAEKELFFGRLSISNDTARETVSDRRRSRESMGNTVNERDWKLFRDRIADWQERFMETLIAEYTILLQDGSRPASDRFWELEKRIKEEKRLAGVVCECTRSALLDNMIRLYCEGAICDEDLEGFSEELEEEVKNAKE